MFDPTTFARPPVILDDVAQPEGMIEVATIRVVP
jgi:hypothetical protein